MKQKYWFLILLLVLALAVASCATSTEAEEGGSAEAADVTESVETDAPDDEAAAEEASQPEEAEEPEQEEEVVEPTLDSGVAETAGEAICLVTGSRFVKDPNLPAVTEADWAEGADAPVLTIIEYSDFQ